MNVTGSREGLLSVAETYSRVWLDVGIAAMAGVHEATVSRGYVLFTPHEPGGVVSPHDVMLVAVYLTNIDATAGGTHYRSHEVDELQKELGRLGGSPIAYMTHSLFASVAQATYVREFQRSHERERILP